MEGNKIVASGLSPLFSLLWSLHTFSGFWNPATTLVSAAVTYLYAKPESGFLHSSRLSTSGCWDGVCMGEGKAQVPRWKDCEQELENTGIWWAEVQLAVHHEDVKFNRWCSHVLHLVKWQDISRIRVRNIQKSATIGQRSIETLGTCQSLQPASYLQWIASIFTLTMLNRLISLKQPVHWSIFFLFFCFFVQTLNGKKIRFPHPHIFSPVILWSDSRESSSLSEYNAIAGSTDHLGKILQAGCTQVDR